MSQPFTKVAILGPGLLGGSIGFACQKAGIETVFWGRKEERLAPVREAGFVASTNIAEIIQGAELIIMAIPVPNMAEMAGKLVESGLTPSQLVTDVGSVKEAVVNAVQPVLGGQGYKFIGSHPMAGSEQQGFHAADDAIMKGATCIVTPDEFTDSADHALLNQFWQGLGMLVSELSAERHDAVISRVSHVPHILASVCAHVALLEQQNGAFSGGGLRDTSRVASGDADLWTGIISENAEMIARHLSEAQARLAIYQEAVASGDGALLRSLLLEDKNRRDAYFTP